MTISFLAARIARDIFAMGDYPEKCTRIQFQGGTWPEKEIDQGGLCEEALARRIAETLMENKAALKSKRL